MANRVGQQFGNYRLIRMLGDGAFAEVYLSEHIHLGTQAAIKVLHAQLSSQDEQKFREEARTIARLIHPHIVRVLEFGIERKIPYLVMDYAPNGTLLDRHPRGTSVPLPIVVTYVKQIAEALQYAHDAKLVHRDVKPENLLIGYRNEILLSDFGIAVAAHSTKSQVLQDKIGTIPYMAPEQIKGYPSPATDQYALGIIVYEWLAGTPPFVGADHEIVVKHLQMAPPSLRANIPALSPLVEQVIFKALEKDSAKRFAKVQAFAAALEQASKSFLVLPPTQPVQLNQSPVASTPPTVLISPTVPAVSPLPPTPTKRAGTLICKRDGLYQSIAWSLDGKYIATAAGKRVIIWDAGTAQDISRFSHASDVTQVAWSFDGNWLASAGNDQTIQIHVPGTGNHEFTYAGHFGAIEQIAWKPDSRLIASVSNDQKAHVWDLLTGYALSIYQGRWVGWSPDGTRLAISTNTGIQILDTANWSIVITIGERVTYTQKIVWSSTTNLIASSGYSDQARKNLVQIWDVTTGRSIFKSDGSNMAWSPNGTYAAIWGLTTPVVQICEVKTGNVIYSYPGHQNIVNSVVWSPNGMRIASCSNDGTVQVWNAVNGTYVYIYRGHTGIVTDVLYSPDGTQIASVHKEEARRSSSYYSSQRQPKDLNNIQIWTAG